MPRAFQDCESLSEITLPAAISGTGSDHGIQDYAFSGCNSLATINFAGTIDQWKRTRRVSNWHETVPATVVHCIDGDCGIDDIPPPIGTAYLSDNTHTLAVGDIIFNDGSYRTYTDGMTLTAAQQAAAIAVIYYVGTDCNNQEDGTRTRVLGVGLEEATNLAWADANGWAYDDNIYDVRCGYTEVSTGNYTFPDTVTGYGTESVSKKNGKDNYDNMGWFASESNTPALYFGKNYKQAASNVTGTEYEDKWYVPSIAELYFIAVSKSTINPIIAACGGSPIGNNYYWSSSQNASSNVGGLFIHFNVTPCGISGQRKSFGESVRAIQEF